MLSYFEIKMSEIHFDGWSSKRLWELLFYNAEQCLPQTVIRFVKHVGSFGRR